MDKSLLRVAWQRGNLSYLLRPYQRELRDFMWDSTDPIVVTASHRGSRKTSTSLVFLLEYAIRRAGSNLKLFCSTAKQMRAIVFPIVRILMRDCPEDLRPRFDSGNQAYFFPNDSVIELFGADSNADAALGTNTHVAVLDEASRFTDLDYIVQSLLLPRVLLVGGKIILPSTPAVTPSHPFTRYMRDAEASGKLFRLTVYDNPHISPEVLAGLEKSLGGKESTAFRRECCAEIVTEESVAAVPELIRTALGSTETEEASDRVAYVGPEGHTVVCGTVVRDNALRIVDECVVKNATPKSLADAVRGLPGALRIRASETFGNDFLVREQLTAAVSQPFTELRDQIGVVRDAVRTGRLLVGPGAPTVRRHLTDAVWDATGKKLDPSGDGGNFEGLLCVTEALRTSSLMSPKQRDWSQPSPR